MVWHYLDGGEAKRLRYPNLSPAHNPVGEGVYASGADNIKKEKGFPFSQTVDKLLSLILYMKILNKNANHPDVMNYLGDLLVNC